MLERELYSIARLGSSSRICGAEKWNQLGSVTAAASSPRQMGNFLKCPSNEQENVRLVN